MSMRGHAESFGMPSPPGRIIATGGGSVNRSFLYIAACVFGCEVYTARRAGKQCTSFGVISSFLIHSGLEY